MDNIANTLNNYLEEFNNLDSGSIKTLNIGYVDFLGDIELTISELNGRRVIHIANDDRGGAFVSGDITPSMIGISLMIKGGQLYHFHNDEVYNNRVNHRFGGDHDMYHLLFVVIIIPLINRIVESLKISMEL